MIDKGESVSMVEGKTSCEFRIWHKGGDPYDASVKYVCGDINGLSGVSYEYSDKFDKWFVIAERDGRPNSIRHFAINGMFDFSFSFDRNGKVSMNGTWDGKPYEVEQQFSHDVSVENSLFLKCMSLDPGVKYCFDLIQTTAYPGLSALPMYYKTIGKENVSVPAGDFTCKKILFSINDMRGVFFQAYYFVTDDAHQEIVKCVNVPQGGKYELIALNREV